MASATEKPLYRVLEGNFYTAKGQMLYPGAQVAFYGEPNLNLESMNDAAKIKMAAFLQNRNELSVAFTDKLKKDRGVYVAPEIYRSRSYDEETAALPSNGKAGKIMGTAPDPDDTEVVYQGPPPGTIDATQPGAVSIGMVHNA